jgi:hypothetical protein
MTVVCLQMREKWFHLLCAIFYSPLFMGFKKFGLIQFHLVMCLAEILGYLFH